MHIEALKYVPENIHPGEFMRPPTESFRPWFGMLSAYLEDQINERFGRKSQATVRIGTEIELFLFASTYDSRVESHSSKNYSPAHLAAFENMKNRLKLPGTKNGLGDILTDGELHIPKLGIELRTQPASVEEYAEQMDTVKAWFRQPENAEIHPVVNSQHIHLSLTGEWNVLTEGSKEMSSAKKGILDINQRGLPMLRLPEEVEDVTQYYLNDDVVRSKGRTSTLLTDPKRIEARINSSEYAFDPHLNLAIQLLGMKRGLDHTKIKHGYRDIDADLPLGPNMYGTEAFTIQHTYYQDVVDYLLRDPVLGEHFPPEVLKGLHGVLSRYREVSLGTMSVATLRDLAKQTAIAIDPDMYIAGN